MHKLFAYIFALILFVTYPTERLKGGLAMRVERLNAAGLMAPVYSRH